MKVCALPVIIRHEPMTEDNSDGNQSSSFNAVEATCMLREVARGRTLLTGEASGGQCNRSIGDSGECQKQRPIVHRAHRTASKHALLRMQQASGGRQCTYGTTTYVRTYVSFSDIRLTRPTLKSLRVFFLDFRVSCSFFMRHHGVLPLQPPLGA